MTTRRDFAYVQARLQAWHGRRPWPETWRSLDAAPDIESYLNAARRASLRPWVIHLTPQMDPHTIERSLRAEYRAHVLRVAQWAPPSWRRAVAWCACLPDLDSARHLALTASSPSWMLEDAWLVRQLSLANRPRPPWLQRILSEHHAQAWPGTEPVATWFEIWRSLLTDADAGAEPGIERIHQTVREHFASMHAADSRASGAELRSTLAYKLARLFRREAQKPGALFCHLALIALDLIQLRGAVLERHLFRSERAVTT